MKKLIFTIMWLMSSSVFAAGHAGLDTTLKCIPNGDDYDLVKELKAISINKLSNVRNKYQSSIVSEDPVAKGIDLTTCLDAITDLEAKKFTIE